MQLTHHPFQRAGAWAAAAVTGKEHPSLVDAADLDGLAAMITADATGAALTVKDGPGYAWWKVLFACYPNSPATHAARARWGRDGVSAKIADLFAADEPATIQGPCDLCGTPASCRWGKSLRPLAAPANHVNSQPAGGWPVCRECRIAMWLLPYGSASNGHLMLTCGSVADEALEAAIARNCVIANREAIGAGLPAWPEGHEWLSPVFAALAEHPGAPELLRWRNDNKAPFLAAVRVDENTAILIEAWEHLAALIDSAPATQDGIRELAAERLGLLRDREWIIRTAYAAGWNVNQIHKLSGISRTTIYKTVAGNGETGETS
jgi:CRISPR-associated protein Cst1